MTCVDRILRVLKQQPVDRAPVVGVTSVVTVDLMRQMGTRWPDAHHDPEQMVRAGAAAHVVCCLESVKVPFDMAVAAEAKPPASPMRRVRLPTWLSNSRAAPAGTTALSGLLAAAPLGSRPMAWRPLTQAS